MNVTHFLLNSILGAIVLGIVVNMISDDIKPLFRSIPFLVHDNRYGGKSFFGLRLFRRLRWKTAASAAKSISDQIKDDARVPDLIVGLGRGGAIFGAMLSYRLAKMEANNHKRNIPLAIFEREYGVSSSGRKTTVFGDVSTYSSKEDKIPHIILIVAGEGHTGKTMIAAVDEIKKSNPSADVYTCVFYDEILSDDLAKKRGITFDYSGIKGKGFNLMPWQDKKSVRESYWGKCTLYIVRHGQTDNNVEDKFIGSGSNVHLNEIGRKQAHEAGQKLENLNVSRIYCSPLDRCKETAEIIKGHLASCNPEIVEEQNLREIDYGVWEQMPRQDIKDKYHALYQQYIEGLDVSIPGSKDTPRKIQKRVRRALKQAISFHEMQRPFSTAVVLVTHKTAGRILINYLKGNKTRNYRSIQMDNASVTKVILEDGKSSIELLPYKNIRDTVQSPDKCNIEDEGIGRST